MHLSCPFPVCSFIHASALRPAFMHAGNLTQLPGRCHALSRLSARSQKPGQKQRKPGFTELSFDVEFRRHIDFLTDIFAVLFTLLDTLCQ